MSEQYERLSYELEGGVATIKMDDGKVNAMSAAMLGELDRAFEQARSDGATVLLCGNAKIFSAGFDLPTLMGGSAEDLAAMLRGGAELCEKMLGFPHPIVVACGGHAYPMGAFLMMSADVRFAADLPIRIGMNEVAIGITIPLFAIEVARARLTPAYFNRGPVTAELFDPHAAAAAGFVDEVVPADQLMRKAREAAVGFAGLDQHAHATTKLRVRGQVLAAVRHAIDEELTLDNARAMVAARDA